MKEECNYLDEALAFVKFKGLDFDFTFFAGILRLVGI